MGLETRCRARIDGVEKKGKLHVDSLALQFKGEDRNWTWNLQDAPLEATVADAWLQLRAFGTLAEFELGPAAAKWLTKIQNPPDLRQKLGLKPGLKVWVHGDLPLKLDDVEVCENLSDADIGLLLIEEREDLTLFLRLNGTKRPVWVIYPKGGKSICEAEVMQAAKQLGMGASKTAAINERLTGLRFMQKRLPLQLKYS